MLEINIINIIVPLIFTAVLIPAKPLPDTYYPSGNNESDKVYPSERPSKQYPLLKLDVDAYDPEFNKIQSGIYSVEYSAEYNMLFIKDSGNVIKAPVFQVIRLNSKTHIPSAKVAFIKDDKVFIIYRKDYLEVQGFLYLPAAVLNQY